MQREEQVQLALPLSARRIEQAISAFQTQFHSPCCYLYVKGTLILATGERCRAPAWLPVVRPDDDLDLLGIGDPDISDDDEFLTWIAPTDASVLLLSTTRLHS